MRDPHLNGLVTELRKGNVIGLCGAGVPANLAYPTWKELMLLLLDRYEATKSSQPDPQMRVTIDAGGTDLPIFAQWIRGKMIAQDYEAFLQEVFLPRAPREFSAEQRLLARLPVRLWMTTNYDTSLEDALASQLGQNVTPQRDIPFSDLHGTDTLPRVVHLHGWISDPDGVVLTSDDYQRLYQQQMRLPYGLKSLASFSLFIVGYGLNDRELTECLEMTRNRLGATARPHYALVPRMHDESDFAVQMRVQKLARDGVLPIFYPASPGAHHARLTALTAILSKLGRDAAVAADQELELRWSEAVSLSDLRMRIKELMPSPVRSRLNYLSLADRSAVFSAMAPDDLERIAQTASGPFWISGRVTAPAPRPAAKPPPPSPQESARTITPADEYRTLLKRDARSELESRTTEFRKVLRPLIAPAPPFGLADVFHPVLDWRLDSPVVHVWIYSDDPSKEKLRTEAVTAIGSGVLHVRSQLETAAFTVALSMPEEASTVVARGVIHLAAPDEESPAAAPASFGRMVRGIFNRGKEQHTAQPEMSPDARLALDEFAKLCRGLAQQTGLVHVHEVPHARTRELHGRLMSAARRADDSSVPIVLRPNAGQGAIKCVPYPRFPQPHLHPRITLTWGDELLRMPLLERLMAAYYENVTRRMLGDIDRRLEFWRNELEGDEAQVTWYKSLSPKERGEVKPVRTGRKIIADLGIDVETPEAFVAPAEYFLAILPNFHIPWEKSEIARLEAARAPIVKLAAEPHSAVWKRCVARIFDCALRNVPLSDDMETESAFEAWRNHAGGLLQAEWTHTASDAGINPDDIFTRTTFFNTNFNEQKNAIEVYPMAVVDSRRATVVFDRERRTMAVLDPLDRVQSIATQATPSASTELFAALASLAGDGADSEKWMRENLFAHPEWAEELCRIPLGERGGGSLEELRAAVRAKEAQMTAGYRALWYLSQGCQHTATEIVEPDHTGADMPAGKALAAAVLLCIEAQLPPIETVQSLYHRADPSVPANVAQLFRYALMRDRDLVESFLKYGSIRMDAYEPPAQEKVAWEIECCLESARMAEKFQAAADSLNPAQESLAAAFFKTDEAVEGAFAALFARPPTTLLRIQKILTGEPFDAKEAKD